VEQVKLINQESHLSRTFFITKFRGITSFKEKGTEPAFTKSTGLTPIITVDTMFAYQPKLESHNINHI